MASNTYRLGANCRLYHGQPGQLAVNFATDKDGLFEWCDIVNGSLTMTENFVREDRRADKYWHFETPTQAVMTASIDFLWVPGDTGRQTFMTCYSTRQSIPVALSDGPTDSSQLYPGTTIDVDLVYSQWWVEGLSRNEPLEDGVTGTLDLVLSRLTPTQRGVLPEWFTAQVTRP